METVEGLEFLSNIFELLKKECVFDNIDQEPVVRFKHPKELEAHINFAVDQPFSDFDDLKATCTEIIRHSIKTAHPHFYNQLYGAVDHFGLAASWITDSLNTNVHTYEVAPTFILAEAAVLKHTRKTFGIGDGDGVFSAGGSMSNMYAMALARFKKFPQVKWEGLYGAPRMVCFTSEDGHYSIQKAAHWLGFGTDNVIKVKTDEQGRMIPDELDCKIKEVLSKGHVPLLVNAFVGTTVFGAIDPLEKVASICDKYGLWFHVDACYGGSLILSRKYRDRLNGIQRSDSFAWNPHKLLCAPLQCSIFVTKHKELLSQCNSAAAGYLFQKDKFYDTSYDTGDKSIQCGRKGDALKLWVMWKARGDLGFEKLIDNVMECTSYFKQQISTRKDFRVILKEFDTTCICFYYIPERLLGLEETEEWREELYKVAPKIKEKMVLEGTLMIGYNPMPQRRLGNFFRIVFLCLPQRTFADMDYVISKIVEYGKDL